MSYILDALNKSESERRALRVAAEGMPGVKAVDDHLVMRPFGT